MLGFCINSNDQHGVLTRLIASFDLIKYHTDFCNASVLKWQINPWGVDLSVTTVAAVL